MRQQTFNRPGVSWQTASGGIISLLLAGGLAIVIGALVAMSGMTFGDKQLDVTLVLAIILVTTAPIVRRIIAGSFNLFEPVVSGCAMLLFIFGVRPMAIVLSGETLYKGQYHIDAYLTETLLVALLGCLAFVAGYELRASRQTRPDEDTQPSGHMFFGRTFYVYCAVLTALAVLLFLVHLSLGGSIIGSLQLMARGRSEALHQVTSSSSEYLSLAPNLAVCSSALILLVNRTPTRLQLVLIAAGILFPSVIFFLVGNRRFILPALLIPILIRYLLKQKQPNGLMLGVVGPVLLIALATIPYARAQGAREAAGGIVPIFQDAFLRPDRTLLHTFTSGDDTEMLYALALEIKTLDKPQEFSYGNATAGDLLIAPIPSAVVPGKPVTARNELLTQVFGQPCKVVAGGLCPDFSVVGTFYQDFWLFGVLGGMTLMGIFSSWTWRRYLQDPTSPNRVGLLACWIVFLPVIIRAGFMPAFSWFLYFSIPVLIGLAISRNRSARTIEEHQ